jgi:hypothetical protein
MSPAQQAELDALGLTVVPAPDPEDARRAYLEYLE